MSNRTRAGALRTIRRVLAADCACEPGDFLEKRVTVVEARTLPGRRRFPVPPRPLMVFTMGEGVVISCHQECEGWIRHYIAGLERDAVFSSRVIGMISQLVESEGEVLAGPYLAFGCSADSLMPAEPPPGVEVSLVRGEDVRELYSHPGFTNALTYSVEGEIRDVAAAVACSGGEIVGIAGATDDCEEMWQIGVDVVETERDRGVGKALVSRLTREVLDRGKVPYYCARISNLRSRSLALSVGYRPAWTSLEARAR